MALKRQRLGLAFLVIALVFQIEQHKSCTTDDLVTGVRSTNIEQSVEEPHIGHLELENSKISPPEDAQKTTSIPQTEDTSKEKAGSTSMTDKATETLNSRQVGTSTITKSLTTNTASTSGSVDTTTSRATISPTTGIAATTVNTTASRATISPTTSTAATTVDTTTSRATISLTTGIAATTVDTTASRATISPTTGIAATTVDTTAFRATISPTTGIAATTVDTTTSRATISPTTGIAATTVDTTASRATISPTTGIAATTVDTTTSRATISPTTSTSSTTVADTTTSRATLRPTTSTDTTTVDATPSRATKSPTTSIYTASTVVDTTSYPVTKSPKTIEVTSTKSFVTPASSTSSFTPSKTTTSDKIDPTFRSTSSPTTITATRAVDNTTTSRPTATATRNRLTAQSTTSSASGAATTPAANLYTPVFYEDLYYAEVEESSPVSTVLLTVQAMDWDEGAGGEIIYNISNETPDGEAFDVHPETGVVALARELDREQKGRYVLNVTATDKGQPQRMAVAVLEIVALDSNDNAPVFDQVRYESVVSENTNSYSRVLHVAASDRDLGRNSEITYKLSGNHKNKFTIDEKSGLIRTFGSLDRERVSQYNFLVIATDHGIPQQEGSAEIFIRVGDVNDNPPKFPTGTIDLVVPENSLPFDLIGKVTATDADEGPNAIVLYAFVQRVRQNWFQIDRRTGVVHTLYRFDREERAEYEVIVRASSGRLFSDARLVIHIGDENDNAPIVPANQIIFYNFYEGTGGYNVIGKVGALDKDAGDSLKYHLLVSAVSLGIGDRRSGGHTDIINHRVGVRFSVDQTTGTIYAYHQEPYSNFKPLTGRLTVNVSDGINSVTCNCTIYMKEVTHKTFENSISMRIRIRSDRETFLSRHRDLVATIANIYRTDEELVTFLIRRGLNDQHPRVTTEAPMLRVSLAVRRRDGTFIPTDELQSMIYLEMERLQTLVDMTPDSIRSLCLLRPTVANTSSVVAPVALGLTYVSFNVVLLTHCQASQGSCASVSCDKFEECLDLRDGFRCQCLFPGNDTCQPPFPAGTCPEAICNRRGACTVNDAGEVSCQCRDYARYDGPHCEMTTRSFTDDSFLAFKPLGRIAREFHITLRFKTSKPNGVLLYNGPYLRGRGESIALQIVGGRLQFIKSSRLGTSVVSASIATDVSDGHWHDVHVNNVGGNILLGIDGCSEDAAHWNIDNADASCIGIGWLGKPPRTQFINLNGPLFLGGIPSFVTATHVTSAHFEGCLNAVQFNSKMLDFSVRLKNVGTSPRCNNKNKTTEAKVKVPRAVKSLSARSRLRSLVIKWSPPKDKSEQLIGYQLSHVEVNDVGESISDTWTVIINGPTQSSFTIDRLTPSTRYKVTIRGYSAAGFGESTTLDATTKANRIR